MLIYLPFMLGCISAERIITVKWKQRKPSRCAMNRQLEDFLDLLNKERVMGFLKYLDNRSLGGQWDMVRSLMEPFCCRPIHVLYVLTTSFSPLCCVHVISYVLSCFISNKVFKEKKNSDHVVGDAYAAASVGVFYLSGSILMDQIWDFV